MAFAPLLIAGIGAAYQGMKSAQTADYNAKVESQQQSNAVNQSNAQEGLVRRASREALGRQAAAFGGAGVGYGGSSEGSLDQSAVNQELDALNTRYKGAITGWGYGAQAKLDRDAAKEDSSAGALLAGAALLKNSGGSYSFAPKSPGQMSGIVSPEQSSGLG
jgi:hypothetical protein